jgi:hypothetical protein
MGGFMDFVKTAGTVNTAINPWIGLAGLGVSAVGSGIQGAEQNKLLEQQLAQDQQKFNWQKKMDTQSQANQQRQLGMNALTGMKDDFKNALYRAFTRG